MSGKLLANLSRENETEPQVEEHYGISRELWKYCTVWSTKKEDFNIISFHLITVQEEEEGM